MHKKSNLPTSCFCDSSSTAGVLLDARSAHTLVNRVRTRRSNIARSDSPLGRQILSLVRKGRRRLFAHFLFLSLMAEKLLERFPDTVLRANLSHKAHEENHLKS